MIGVDEVGRGAWAGPLLVVAARASKSLPIGIADSKLLSRQQRDRFYSELSSVCEFGEGWVEPAEIDQLGLSSSLTIAVSRALESIGALSHEHVVLDGAHNYIPASYKLVETIVKADGSVPVVSAASIWAKVRRDSYMAKLARSYPEYGFGQHVGYGTQAHHIALRKYGPKQGIHRFCFKPVRELI